jgi:chemotaxis protein methyltransferase CheR
MLNASAVISDKDFNRLSEFIHGNYGIKMPIGKKPMLESRLKARLRATKKNNFEEYCEYLFSVEGMQHEVVHMIDVVSTNKTDFYREAAHFDYLQNIVLPELAKTTTSTDLKVWCAATSTGEEPYTIAFTLEEYMVQQRRLTYSIFCTDISTQVLDKAITGVYPTERIVDVPFHLRSKYFLKSKNPQNHTVRVIPDIRKNLSFSRLNLIDDFYQTPHLFHVIFCRNVLIYFDRKTQEAVINKLCAKLVSGGFLFLGHSESIAGFDLPLKTIKTSVHKKI